LTFSFFIFKKKEKNFKKVLGIQKTFLPLQSQTGAKDIKNKILS